MSIFSKMMLIVKRMIQRRELEKWREFESYYMDEKSKETICILNESHKFGAKPSKMLERLIEINSITNFEIPYLGSYEREKKIAVFGKGDMYEYTISLIKNSIWKNNLLLLNEDEKLLKEVATGTSVILAYEKKLQKKFDRLKEKYKDIEFVIPPYNVLAGFYGNQYFDVFTPDVQEVVIDAGAFNGETEKEILEWGGDKVKKIYAFELDPQNAEACKRTYERIGGDKIVFINKGTGSKSEEIFIDSGLSGTAGSCIGKGNRKAIITTIDDELRNREDRVTYIKMDVEGAELESLIGAKEIICQDKPKLAICIYHKYEDPYVIPKYLLSLVPEYKFVVRHYCSWSWETVLYASVDL